MGDALGVPSQPALSLGDLQGALPTRIPRAMAGALLRPIDQGAFVDLPYAAGPFSGDGCTYGSIPNLVDYGVYSRLLYYPCRSVWVPYILVDDCYYPYAYEPCFLPEFSGYCLYPVLYFNDGCYYPYFFHSHAYYYGYLDWEYNWLPFREHHRDYDWDAIGYDHDRHYDQHDFDEWRSGHWQPHERSDWQPHDLPRTHDGDRYGGDRPDGGHAQGAERARDGGQGGDRPHGDGPQQDERNHERQGEGRPDAPPHRPERSDAPTRSSEHANSERSTQAPRNDARPDRHGRAEAPSEHGARQGKAQRGNGHRVRKSDATADGPAEGTDQVSAETTDD